MTWSRNVKGFIQLDRDYVYDYSVKINAVALQLPCAGIIILKGEKKVKRIE